MANAVRFGTDGIRGRVGDEITVDLAYRLGRAVAAVFNAPVFVGHDTRESSPELAAAVLAGLADGGATGVNLGLFTTPGVAVTAMRRAGVGVVVSASHNPYYDNGLKVLGPGGGKLDHATEEAVTAALDAAPAPVGAIPPAPLADASAEAEYVAHLRAIVPGNFSAMHLVIDCANGAASHVARSLFSTTEARLTIINDQPDGHNINLHCGSTHVEGLVATVKGHRADLGLAFDGDADRLIAVDAQGVVRDGDDMMVLFALDFLRSASLDGGLVVTSMSNLGVHRALSGHDVDIVETDVGDRNVLLALEEREWSFGGEQSGHLIFRDLSPTGDGLLTGLLLADLLVRRGPLFAQAEGAWHRVPQALVNVARDAYDDVTVRALFAEIVAERGVDERDVRLLIRPSGTEPVVRVMVEALDGDVVVRFTQRLIREHGVVVSTSGESD
jgi:phosphoglucosamine mutase